MPPEDGAPCRRLSSLCDADVDFSTFQFLPSNPDVHDEQTVDSVNFYPMSAAGLVPEGGIVAAPKPDAKLDGPGAARENVEDATSGLRADSSDPLLFTDGLEYHAANADVADSPPLEAHKILASPRYILPRPSSANPAGLAFPEIDATIAEERHLARPERSPLRGRPSGLVQGDIFLSHEIQVVGRRRSQSVPPNDMSFHRQLGTGSKLHIGRPTHRPTGSVQRPHPYDNARLKRFSGGRHASHNQRLATVPTQIPRGYQHLDGALYSPANPTVNPAAFDMGLQQSPTSLEAIRQHPDFAMGNDGLRRPNIPALQQAPTRQVPLTDYQHLCERLLYRLGVAAEGTRRDAMMMGQDPALDMCVCLPP
jgi:hypothetical protein